MKKLMIAAAVAAMTAGVFGAACDIVSEDCASVYDVTFTVKTTKCVCKNTKKTTKNPCGIEASSGGCYAWRDVETKKINGVLIACGCGCGSEFTAGAPAEDSSAAPSTDATEMNALEWMTGADTAAFILDDDGNLVGNQMFWIAKEKAIVDEAMLLKLEFSRMGNKGTKVEAAGTFGADIAVAGHGTYDAKNDCVKSLTGNFAGVIAAPIDCTDEEGSEVCPAYNLCDFDPADEDLVYVGETFTDGTAAFGSWTLKYNSSKSKAYGKSGNALVNGKVFPKAVMNYDNDVKLSLGATVTTD